MKVEKFSGTVESAYGKVLATPVKFSGEYNAFENFDELKTANEIPSNDDIVNFVNAKRKASARATATTEALTAAGIQKPDPNTPEAIKSRMIADAMKANPALTLEVATARVEAVLG